MQLKMRAFVDREGTWQIWNLLRDNNLCIVVPNTALLQRGEKATTIEISPESAKVLFLALKATLYGFTPPCPNCQNGELEAGKKCPVCQGTGLEYLRRKTDTMSVNGE